GAGVSSGRPAPGGGVAGGARCGAQGGFRAGPAVRGPYVGEDAVGQVPPLPPAPEVEVALGELVQVEHERPRRALWVRAGVPVAGGQVGVVAALARGEVDAAGLVAVVGEVRDEVVYAHGCLLTGAAPVACVHARDRGR